MMTFLNPALLVVLLAPTQLQAGDLVPAPGPYPPAPLVRRPDPRREEPRTFWGGPFWGFGPRLSNPCRSCDDLCPPGVEASPRCRRCQLKCGW